MSVKNFADELTSAAGPEPFPDAESTHDAVIFCAAVNASYARFLNECAIIDNEMLHRVDDEIDFRVTASLKIIHPPRFCLSRSKRI